MTKLESIRTYIMKCPHLDKNTQVSIDVMSARPTEYLISETPSSPIVEKFLNNSSLRQFMFTFSSKELIGSVKQNLDNNKFFEDFKKWLETMSMFDRFPEMDDDEEAMELSATTGGYIFEADEKSARYQIQCRLLYIKN